MEDIQKTLEKGSASTGWRRRMKWRDLDLVVPTVWDAEGSPLRTEVPPTARHVITWTFLSKADVFLLTLS